MTVVAVVAAAAVHVTAAVAVLYVLPLFWDTLNLPAAPLDDDPTTTEGTRHD